MPRTKKNYLKPVKRNKRTGEPMWQVERIVNKKLEENSSRWIYEVKWRGWGEADNTWEPIEHLKEVLDLVQKFEMKSTDKNQQGKKEEKFQEKQIQKIQNIIKNSVQSSSNSSDEDEEQQMSVESEEKKSTNNINQQVDKKKNLKRPSENIDKILKYQPKIKKLQIDDNENKNQKNQNDINDNNKTNQIQQKIIQSTSTAKNQVNAKILNNNGESDKKNAFENNQKILNDTLVKPQQNKINEKQQQKIDHQNDKLKNSDQIQQNSDILHSANSNKSKINLIDNENNQQTNIQKEKENQNLSKKPNNNNEAVNQKSSIVINATEQQQTNNDKKNLEKIQKDNKDNNQNSDLKIKQNQQQQQQTQQKNQNPQENQKQTQKQLPQEEQFYIIEKPVKSIEKPKKSELQKLITQHAVKGAYQQTQQAKQQKNEKNKEDDSFARKNINLNKLLKLDQNSHTNNNIINNNSSSKKPQILPTTQNHPNKSRNDDDIILNNKSSSESQQQQIRQKTLDSNEKNKNSINSNNNSIQNINIQNNNNNFLKPPLLQQQKVIENILKTTQNQNLQPDILTDFLFFNDYNNEVPKPPPTNSKLFQLLSNGNPQAQSQNVKKIMNPINFNLHYSLNNSMNNSQNSILQNKNSSLDQSKIQKPQNVLEEPEINQIINFPPLTKHHEKQNQVEKENIKNLKVNFKSQMVKEIEERLQGKNILQKNHTYLKFSSDILKVKQANIKINLENFCENLSKISVRQDNKNQPQQKQIPVQQETALNQHMNNNNKFNDTNTQFPKQQQYYQQQPIDLEENIIVFPPLEVSKSTKYQNIQSYLQQQKMKVENFNQSQQINNYLNANYFNNQQNDSQFQIIEEDEEQMQCQQLVQYQLQQQQQQVVNMVSQNLTDEQWNVLLKQVPGLHKDALDNIKVLRDNQEKEKLQLQKQRVEKEKLEKEKQEKERVEKERVEKERVENERVEKERVEKERVEKVAMEKERLEKENIEKEQGKRSVNLKKSQMNFWIGDCTEKAPQQLVLEKTVSKDQVNLRLKQTMQQEDEEYGDFKTDTPLKIISFIGNFNNLQKGVFRIAWEARKVSLFQKCPTWVNYSDAKQNCLGLLHEFIVQELGKIKIEKVEY